MQRALPPARAGLRRFSTVLSQPQEPDLLPSFSMWRRKIAYILTLGVDSRYRQNGLGSLLQRVTVSVFVILCPIVGKQLIDLLQIYLENNVTECQVRTIANILCECAC